MRTFELNKIYKNHGHCGIGYDQVSWNQYYMPVKKSNSSIWVAEFHVELEQWGKTIHTEEEADEIAKKVFNNGNYSINRKTLRTDEEQEYFKYKDEYTFAKYIKEVK